MLCSSKLVSFSFCFDKWHNLRAIFVKVNMQNFIFLYKIWFLINNALKHLCCCWVIKLCKWDIWILCKTTQVSPFFLAKCLCFSSVSLSTNTDHLTSLVFRAFIYFGFKTHQNILLQFVMCLSVLCVQSNMFTMHQVFTKMHKSNEFQNQTAQVMLTFESHAGQYLLSFNQYWIWHLSCYWLSIYLLAIICCWRHLGGVEEDYSGTFSGEKLGLSHKFALENTTPPQ